MCSKRELRPMSGCAAWQALPGGRGGRAARRRGARHAARSAARRHRVHLRAVERRAAGPAGACQTGIFWDLGFYYTDMRSARLPKQAAVLLCVRSAVHCMRLCLPVRRLGVTVSACGKGCKLSPCGDKDNGGRLSFPCIWDLHAGHQRLLQGCRLCI